MGVYNVGYIRITGGKPLQGELSIKGAKNAVLPILAASLLCDEKVEIRNVPNLLDVDTMTTLLERLGCRVEWNKEEGVIDIEKGEKISMEAPYELVSKMRASFNILAPLTLLNGQAMVPLPGGCSIGYRPVDLHIEGLKRLGFEMSMIHGIVESSIKMKPRGAHIYLDFPSVGATEHIMTAAALASGETFIENAAREPEVEDLANFLNCAGAKIRGAGTSKIKIEGVKRLKGCMYTVIPDRIQTGTYMIMTAATRGNVILKNVILEHLSAPIAKLKDIGVHIHEVNNKEVRITNDSLFPGTNINVLPYPGFPTDLQPQIMALLSVVRGVSVVKENVFKNRFMHVDELRRMGANIRLEGSTAIINGIKELSAAPVIATDLRAGAALLIAGLMTHGETIVKNIEHIFRGYNDLKENLERIGADVKWSKMRTNIKGLRFSAKNHLIGG